jgi:hypothetical protein
MWAAWQAKLKTREQLACRLNAPTTSNFLKILKKQNFSQHVV